MKGKIIVLLMISMFVFGCLGTTEEAPVKQAADENTQELPKVTEDTKLGPEDKVETESEDDVKDLPVEELPDTKEVEIKKLPGTEKETGTTEVKAVSGDAPVTSIVSTSEYNEDAPTQNNTYTLADVSTHITEDDCWVAIEGKVYDYSLFISQHKDNTIINLCGIDGTDAFRNKHSSGTIRGDYIGDLVE